jgi:hypothetical protein
MNSLEDLPERLRKIPGIQLYTPGQKIHVKLTETQMLMLEPIALKILDWQENEEKKEPALGAG